MSCFHCQIIKAIFMSCMISLYIFLLLTAIMFIYIPLLLAMFICFHILSVFWAVMFPFHARSYKLKGYHKYVHLTMLLLALILPWIAIIVAFDQEKYQRFPPITCHPGSNVITYGIIWPACIMLAISLSLTAIIFWVIIRLYRKKRRKQGGKVITIFCKPLACIFSRYFFMHIASILLSQVYRSVACTLADK